MSTKGDLTKEDVPLLLKQLESQNKCLVEAEKKIEQLKLAAAEQVTVVPMTVDEKDEADLEIETLEDRLKMTEDCLTFFFHEYCRLNRILEKNNIVDKENALIRAADHGRIHIVGMLLEAGVDVNARDQANGTALIAASYNGHADVVVELLQYKAETNIRDDGGHTALIFSCDKGHMEICTSLIDAGCDLNIRDNRGNSGLIMAAFIGHIDVCHLLVQRGSQVNHQNSDGRTPLMMACYPPEVETRYLNAKTDICELLIGAGADVNAVNLSGNTALHIASKYCHHDECTMLLKAGANLDARNLDGLRPLDVAGDDMTKALLLKKLKSAQTVTYSMPPSSPKTEQGNVEKTRARRSSMTMLKNVFKLGGKDKDIEESEKDSVDDMYKLYGASDRINDKKVQATTSNGGRQRYAFMQENTLARKGQSDLTASKNAIKGARSIRSASEEKKMSVGEKNALNFSNMTKRNSLDRCPSSGNDATSTRDSLNEVRERRKRQSSGASGDLARQLEEMRKRSANNNAENFSKQPRSALI